MTQMMVLLHTVCWLWWDLTSHLSFRRCTTISKSGRSRCRMWTRRWSSQWQTQKLGDCIPASSRGPAGRDWSPANNAGDTFPQHIGNSLKEIHSHRRAPSTLQSQGIALLPHAVPRWYSRCGVLCRPMCCRSCRVRRSRRMLRKMATKNPKRAKKSLDSRATLRVVAVTMANPLKCALANSIMLMCEAVRHASGIYLTQQKTRWGTSTLLAGYAAGEWEEHVSRVATTLLDEPTMRRIGLVARKSDDEVIDADDELVLAHAVHLGSLCSHSVLGEFFLVWPTVHPCPWNCSNLCTTTRRRWLRVCMSWGGGGWPGRDWRSWAWGIGWGKGYADWSLVY